MPARLIILDPGHFHASLLQKDMYPWLDARVAVYAQFGPEVLDYISRVSLFNSRSQNPTRWELDIHLSADPLAAMLRDRLGEIVVITGRNRGKIDKILAALSAGMHVLADKPWIISSADLPKLDQALALAEKKNVAAYDIMTERYEITSEIQRSLVNSPEVFGKIETGTTQNPAVRARSIHHVMKVVAGVPLRRPAWFFDIAEYGEGLADVGTHVVDLVQWTLFPEKPIDYRTDVQITAGRRWPLTLSKAQFAQVTGSELPTAQLDYYCNNAVNFTLRGVHVDLEILWNWEAPAGAGDVYEASFRGSKSRIEIRQGAAEKHVPELYIVPEPAVRSDVFASVDRAVADLQKQWPGLSAARSEREVRIVIPEKFRVGHEAHFAQVANHFRDYVQSPASVPTWERSYMLSKYYVSTKGVEQGHK